MTSGNFGFSVQVHRRLPRFPLLKPVSLASSATTAETQAPSSPTHRVSRITVGASLRTGRPFGGYPRVPDLCHSMGRIGQIHSASGHLDMPSLVRTLTLADAHRRGRLPPPHARRQPRPQPRVEAPYACTMWKVGATGPSRGTSPLPRSGSRGPHLLLVRDAYLRSARLHPLCVGAPRLPRRHEEREDRRDVEAISSGRRAGVSPVWGDAWVPGSEASVRGREAGCEAGRDRSCGLQRE